MARSLWVVGHSLTPRLRFSMITLRWSLASSERACTGRGVDDLAAPRPVSLLQQYRASHLNTPRTFDLAAVPSGRFFRLTGPFWFFIIGLLRWF